MFQTTSQFPCIINSIFIHKGRPKDPNPQGHYPSSQNSVVQTGKNGCIPSRRSLPFKIGAIFLLNQGFFTSSSSYLSFQNGSFPGRVPFVLQIGGRVNLGKPPTKKNPTSSRHFSSSFRNGRSFSTRKSRSKAPRKLANSWWAKQPCNQGI